MFRPVSELRKKCTFVCMLMALLLVNQIGYAQYEGEGTLEIHGIDVQSHVVREDSPFKVIISGYNVSSDDGRIVAGSI